MRTIAIASLLVLSLAAGMLIGWHRPSSSSLQSPSLSPSQLQSPLLSPPPVTHVERKPPPGRGLQGATIGKIAFSGGDTALMLKYYTDVDIHNYAALQAEAEVIWKGFQVQVEKTGLQCGILSANEVPHGFISQTIMVNFVFEKQPTGQWLLSEKNKAAKEDSLATQ